MNRKTILYFSLFLSAFLFGEVSLILFLNQGAARSEQSASGSAVGIIVSLDIERNILILNRVVIGRADRPMRIYIPPTVSVMQSTPIEDSSGVIYSEKVTPGLLSALQKGATIYVTYEQKDGRIEATQITYGDLRVFSGLVKL